MTRVFEIFFLKRKTVFEILRRIYLVNKNYGA